MYAIRNTDVKFGLFANNTAYKGTIKVNKALADEIEARLIPFAPLGELADILKIFWDAQVSRNCTALDEKAVSDASKICDHIIHWLAEMISLKQYFAEKDKTKEN